MSSFLEKLKFWQKEGKENQSNAYCAAEELLNLALNDPTAEQFGLDQETSALLRREILTSVRKTLSRENRTEAVRTVHGNLVSKVAAFGVLVVKPESVMFTGITGKLREEIPRLIEVDEELHKYFHELPDPVTTLEDMISAITFNAFTRGIWLKAYEAVRISLGDSYKDPTRDWGMPYLISQQIFCEWIYRKKLKLPSNLSDDGLMISTALEAQLHSLWPQIIDSGVKDPRAVWEAEWVKVTKSHSPFYGKAL